MGSIAVVPRQVIVVPMDVMEVEVLVRGIIWDVRVRMGRVRPLGRQRVVARIVAGQCWMRIGVLLIARGIMGRTVGSVCVGNMRF